MLHLSLSFCTWYHASNAITGFCIIYDCLKEIENYYLKKKKSKRNQVKGIDEFVNLKDDDEAKEEEGVARVREDAIAWEGEEMGVDAG